MKMYFHKLSFVFAITLLQVLGFAQQSSVVQQLVQDSTIQFEQPILPVEIVEDQEIDQQSVDEAAQGISEDRVLAQQIDIDEKSEQGQVTDNAANQQQEAGEVTPANEVEQPNIATQEADTQEAETQETGTQEATAQKADAQETKTQDAGTQEAEVEQTKQTQETTPIPAADEEMKLKNKKRKWREKTENRDADIDGEATEDEETTIADDVADNVGSVADNVGSVADKVTSIISISNILTAIVILFMIWFTTRVNNWSMQYLVKRFNRHRLKILRAQPIINVFLWIVGLFSLIFTLFHPSQDALMAMMGSSALALGFAAQDIVKNIFGGLLILFDRPFQIGDRVNIDNSYGEVMNIGLRNTQINTLDDSIVTVPNAKIISDNVSNANSGALDCMVVVDLWLPIDINVETVRKISFEAAITSRYLNIDKPVVILFFDHFNNKPATNVKIKAYVLDARYEKAFAGDVTEAAKKALKSADAYNPNREMKRVE